MVKIAVLAPMPSASVTSAAAVNPGRAPQHAEPVPHVLPERVDKRQAALVAPRLGDLGLASELQPRGAPRRRGVEPAGAVTLFEHLEVEPQLLAELPVTASETERASGAREQFTQAHGSSSVARRQQPRHDGRHAVPVVGLAQQLLLPARVSV